MKSSDGFPFFQTVVGVVVAGSGGMGSRKERASEEAEVGIVNPFEYGAPPSALELVKLVFFYASGLALIRLVLFVLLMLSISLTCTIATIGLNPRKSTEEPLHPVRRVLLWPVRYLVRAVLFVFGFWSIQVVGKPDRSAAYLTPNHCSLFDALIVFYFAPCAPVAKAEVFKIPLIHRILIGLQGIPVERESKEGRQRTKDAMERYVNDERFPHLLIFPQGTTTRGDCLSMFQRGAFANGDAIQPVALDYSGNSTFNLAYVVTRSKDYFFRRHFSQFSMHCKITFLPVRRPNTAEKMDPTLYANNVRQSIAEVLGPETRCTDHYFEDAKLYRSALKVVEAEHALDLLEKPEESDRVHLGSFRLIDLKEIFKEGKKWGPKEVSSVFSVFQNVDKDKNGLLDYAEFCAAVGFNEESDQAKVLFSFFDKDSTGSVNFREMVLSLAMCSEGNSSKEKVKLAFELFDTNKDGSISMEELEAIASTFPSQTDGLQDLTKLQRLVQAAKLRNPPLDKDGNPLISFELFEQLIEEEPHIMDRVIEHSVRSLYSNSSASDRSEEDSSRKKDK